MIDLFGIKAKQTSLNHLKRIYELERKVDEQKLYIELLSQKLDRLQNEVTWFGNDIDFPNSRYEV